VDEDNTGAIALYKRWGFDFMTYLQMNIDTKNPRD
jgi:ribosomal protein S18 acetylase RimI-like enzyme